MTYSIRFAVFLILFISPRLFAQWVNIPSGTITTLNSVNFLGENVGWVVGDSGLVRKTLNGALTWTTQVTNTLYAIRNIHALNINNLIISGDNGVILRTTNGGTNWVIVSPLDNMSSGNPPNYYDIDFLNSNSGITIGQTRHYAFTTNGGANWVTGVLNVAGQLNIDYPAVDLIDNLNSFAASADFQSSGQWTSYVQKSTNNGSLYGIVKTVNSPARCAFTDLEFINLNTGFATNQNGMVYRTSNSGSTWDSVALGFTPNSIEFANTTTGYICGGGGYLSKTTDGGLTWLQQITPVNNELKANFSYDDVTVYAVGNGGTIIKTVNGGSYVGISIIGTEIPAEYNLSQNYPNPFNPSTNISFDIPLASQVKLSIFNILGMEVKVLADEYFSPGKYETQFNASDLPSGTYFYRLKAGDFIETKKMILIK